MSFSYVPDDQVVESIQLDAKSEGSEESFDFSAFAELGESAQRLSMNRCVRSYVDGGVRGAVSVGEKVTGEKMFRVDKLVEWTSGDLSSLVDEMRGDRVRCRFSAAMGMGKSTRMPSFIAKELNCRVLYVTLDAVALQQTIDYVHGKGIGRYSRSWSHQKKNWLVGMTYNDFNGCMASSKRTQLFKNFEVIIFDEAFVDSADVFVAKRAFAVYSLAHTSLIMCSATIKKSEGGDEEGGSSQLGSFNVTRQVSVEEAVASGKLLGDYLADRTIVFLPDDDTVNSVARYYSNGGVDTFILDSASTYDDFVLTQESLLGDSSTPRVVVSSYKHGIGFNMPVSQPLIFPFKHVLKCVDGGVITQKAAMSEEYVTQCKSRSGRGIVDGSSGFVFGDERLQASELAEDEKTAAFVRLFAANIVPSRAGFWSKQYEMFPAGLSHALANSLVKICLPAEVAIRYFGTDGKVASNYCAAVNIFSQPNTFLSPSKDAEPVHRDMWKEEAVLVTRGATLEVPVSSTGELQIVIQSIELMSKGLIKIAKWIPNTGLCVDDGYDSNEERKEKFVAIPTLRKVIDRPLPSLPEAQRPAIPWSYSATDEVDRRSGGFIDKSRFAEALARLEAGISQFSVDHRRVEEIGNVRSDDKVSVKYGDGIVETPGGSEVCVLPLRMCEKLNTGVMLRSDEAAELLKQVRDKKDMFVASKLFDNFSGPWDSIINTFASVDVAKDLTRHGLANDAYGIISLLSGRLGVEVTNILANSNVYKKTFFFFFKKFPSFESVVKSIREGNFDGVAQTQGFLNRVMDIKARLDTVLLMAERVGVYLPMYITQNQRSIPLRDKNVLGYVGDGIDKMPKKWKKQLLENGNDIPVIKGTDNGNS